MAGNTTRPTAAAVRMRRHMSADSGTPPTDSRDRAAVKQQVPATGQPSNSKFRQQGSRQTANPGNRPAFRKQVPATGPSNRGERAALRRRPPRRTRGQILEGEAEAVLPRGVRHRVRALRPALLDAEESARGRRGVRRRRAAHRALRARAPPPSLHGRPRGAPHPMQAPPGAGRSRC